jgi:electron transfer flavoprotein beta subunit
MNILVCISNVPDTTSKINFKNNDTEFDSNGVQYIINPNDEFGLTRAIWFQQKNNAEVTVLTVGDQTCEPILRKCLAIGANKAIRIDSVPKDGYFVASQISEICKINSYDLIICGRESIDYNGAMVGGILSTMINYSYVANCIGLSIDNKKATLEREIDGGKEVLISELPIIIGSQKGLVEEKDLIIPNMRGIMQAKQKPLEVIPAYNNNNLTQTNKFFKPQPKKEVKLVDSGDVNKLIDLLQNEAKVL